MTSTLFYLLYPIFWLLTWIFYIVYWILSPLIYLGYLLKEVILLPVRFLAKFEVSKYSSLGSSLTSEQPLLYFLGSAVLIGAILALVIHFTLRVLVVVFDLDRKPIPKPIPPTGHSAASYREARQAKKKKELEKQQKLAAEARLIASQPLMQEAVRQARETHPAASSASPLSPGTGRPALLQETILEHTDEEEDDDSAY